MSKKNESFSFDELSGLLKDGLTRAVTRPTIHGYHPHPKQVEFHSSSKQGKLYIGGNRCLSGSTLILMSDGNPRRIDQIQVGDKIVAGDGTIISVTEVHVNGVQSVFRYTIGRRQDLVEVVCTKDHKFLDSTNSMRAIGELAADKIHLRLQRSNGTKFGYYESRALVLGLMLGDGYIAPKSYNMHFACEDEALIKDLPGLFVPRSFSEGKPVSWRFADAKKWHAWFDELGLAGTKSRTKFIPPVVWQWDEESIRDLCAGLIITDGSFFMDRDNVVVAFCSINRELVSDFRRLMGLRLGIWGSRIMADQRGNFKVTYSSEEAVRKISRLPILGIKRGRAKSPFKYNARYHTKSSLVGVKKVSYAGQQKTYDITVDHPDHNFMLANGLVSSNSGKTVGGIVEDIWWMRGEHPYRRVPPAPTRGRIVTVSYTEGIEMIIIPELARWIPPSDLINGSWEDSYDRSKRILKLSNGSTAELMSYDQDLKKFMGTSRHWCHMDEEPPKSIYNENKMRLLDTAGSWWITMTPVEGMTWVYDDIYLRGLEGGNIEIIVIDTAENPYVSSAEIEQVMSDLDDNERKARQQGKFVQLGGVVFTEFQPHLYSKGKGGHIIPSLSENGLKAIQKWTHYSSVDVGINHPTVWLWHAVSPEGAVITYDEIFDINRTIESYADEWNARNQQENRVYPFLNIGDPAMGQRSRQTGDNDFQAYLKYGVPIVSGQKMSQTDGVEKMQRYLKLGKWAITENCTNLTRSLQRTRWKVYESAKKRHENPPRQEIHDKDKDPADSARYFFTFMPDLYVPKSQPDRTSRVNQFVGETLGAVRTPRGPLYYDENLRNSGPNKKEWTVVDEHLGGYW